MESREDRIRRILSDGVPRRADAPRPEPRLRPVEPGEQVNRLPASEQHPPREATPPTAPTVPETEETASQDELPERVHGTRASPARSVDRIPPALRARLEALGVGVGRPGVTPAPMRKRGAQDPSGDAGSAATEGEAMGTSRAAPAKPGTPPPGFPPAVLHAARTAEDANANLPLEDWVGGIERETPHGPFLYVERRYDLTTCHGTLPLATGLKHPVPLRPHEQGPTEAAQRFEALRAADAVFIDTETTGLSGGTGTVAFLVGTGRVEGDAFVVRQYCMRDYPEEGAMLHALGEDLGEAPLVSFNGRGFDWPLLTTRFRLHRMPVRPRAHLDLLPPARRIWAGTLHSHGLAALERYVLGLERGEDLPGWRIPRAYFEFLRHGDADTIAQAFLHNEVDVVSMLTLFGRIAETVHDPIRPVARPADQLGTARLLLDLGRPEEARRCLEAGLDACDDGESFILDRLLGRLCRQAGDDDRALEHWRRAAEEGPGFDTEAYEQVAKIYEHRLQSFDDALAWTRKALTLCPAGSEAAMALEHRARRLERRIARRPTSTGNDAPSTSR